MPSHNETLQEFVRTGNELKSTNVFVSRGIVYSYGHHFPLMLKLNTSPYFLINADSRSVSTSTHQNYANHAAGDQGVAIPFSALDQAGIPATEWPHTLKDTITVLDNNKGTWETLVRINPKTNEKEQYSHHTLGGALITYNPPGRGHKRYFISGIDSSAHPGKGYFLTELKLPVQTLEQAYEELKPKEIRTAEAEDRLIERQGEFFFIKLNNENTPHIPKYKIKKGQFLPTKAPLPKNHKARESAKIPHYPLMIRGTIRHISGDHKMLNLGENWWAVHHNRQRISYNIVGGYD